MTRSDVSQMLHDLDHFTYSENLLSPPFSDTVALDHFICVSLIVDPSP